MDLILDGVPASSSRGALGWCSVGIFRNEGEVLLFDTGSFGDRSPLIHGLAKRGVRLEDVSYVFLSHLHFDHMVNYELFPNAKIYVSKKEVEYALSPSADIYISKLHVRHLLEHRHVEYVQEGDRIFNFEVLALPGHTPGLLGLADSTSVYTSDALKYAWNLAQLNPGQCFAGAEQGKSSLEKIKRLGKLVIPGHDGAFHLDASGGIEYVTVPCTDIDVYDDPYKEGPAQVPLFTKNKKV